MQIGSGISSAGGVVKSALMALAMTALGLAAVNPALAVYKKDQPLPPNPGDLPKEKRGIFLVDGEFVHNVGEIQCNITNWGLIGSYPGTNARWADAPSAMWPAGSGVDYLFAAAIWVGAMKNGVPAVSTGQYEYEFLPNPDDPLETIWPTAQGVPHGARYPDPNYDDDKDGLENEEYLNGLDDDGDGAIDEDYAAIGNQHFFTVNRDNTSLAIETFPDHDPLDLEVRQESFQWENESVDDFIGFQFTLKNIGVNNINDIYLGWFADSDVGPRGGTSIAEDDLPWFFAGQVRAADGSLVPIAVACMYDADGDDGQSPGFFGILFLDHPTDPLGETAPQFVGAKSFQAFAGNQPFDRGGDPTNDAERYDLMSRVEFDQTPPLHEEGKANDFRIMLATGPFKELRPDETLGFKAAILVGPGPDGVVRNASEAALTFYGAWFDRDQDKTTGVKGRERKICRSDFEDPQAIFGIWQDCVDSLDLTGENPPSPISENDLDADGCVWINGDCLFETLRGVADNCPLDDDGVDPAILSGCTGVRGKEYNVPWLVGLAPEPPDMRLWQTDNRVEIFWNNKSQLIPDVRLQKVDFESYRVWRADGWDRPFGSSIDNGPESKLWQLIAEFDLVDYFEDRRNVEGGEFVQELPLGANTGLDVVLYTPAVLKENTPESQEYADLDALVRQIVAENPGFGPSIDPSSVLRYRDANGRVTPIGEQYPELEQWECCYDQADTIYSDAVGIQFFHYTDNSVHNGIYYFYAVTATDFNADASGEELLPIGPGLVGDPQSNFEFAIPTPKAQTAEERSKFGQDIYVVPNPATREALAEFSELHPNANDPTGIRVMFANLPAARNTIRIFTLSGDLVEEIEHDGRNGDGAAFWNLISRNGQEVVSGVYLYSVESSDAAFDRVVGRFVIVR